MPSDRAGKAPWRLGDVWDGRTDRIVLQWYRNTPDGIRWGPVIARLA